MCPILLSVSLVSPDAAYRELWRSELAAASDLVVLDVLENSAAAEAVFAVRPPQVALVDARAGGTAALTALCSVAGETAVVVAGERDEDVVEALRAGAVGFLTRTSIEPWAWVQAVREARAGGAPLSRGAARWVVGTFARGDHRSPELSGRERDVLAQLAAGATYQAVAEQLGISTDTVRAHIRSLYRKLQVNSRAEALRRGAALLAP